MINQQIVHPGPNNTLLNKFGEQVLPPKGWKFLPAGDAAITRKITSKGIYWRVQFKKGKRMISKGIWAPKEVIEEAQAQVEAMRSSDAYQKKRVTDLKRRAQKQNEYEHEFLEEVEKYLNFHPKYKNLEKQMAAAITKHAVPVGSGTVARTAMIPIEERAAKAVIAWMRHQTTGYDNLRIARIKGERRAVRRQLAQRSVALLNNYRNGEIIAPQCPLRKALLTFATNP
jgi:hypothetical protein